jgi:hypothetical protein
MWDPSSRTFGTLIAWAAKSAGPKVDTAEIEAERLAADGYFDNSELMLRNGSSGNRPDQSDQVEVMPRSNSLGKPR